MTDAAVPWDLLVVGGGTAGIVGSQTAAGLGARVLLVEADRTGGDCLWTGCVPSKALLAAAAAAAHARRAERFGVRVGQVDIDLPAVMAHVRQAVEHIAPVDSPEALEREGVRVRAGRLRFTGPDTAEIDGDQVRFRQALVATGAAPAVPPIPGMGDVVPLTTETFWELSAPPARLVILGGGSVGCELAQALARLGVRVTLVEQAGRLLTREDPDAAALVRRALEDDGVVVLTGRRGASVTADSAVEGAGELTLDDGHRLRFDRLLVAVGRVPRTQGLGLAEAGVDLDGDGSPVVECTLRTTNPRIWAAGDVTAHPRFTHIAGVHASIAAGNAVLGLRRRVDPDAVPRVAFTDPEVAAVGVATGAPRSGDRVVEWGHGHVDRAVAEDDTDGWTRLVVDRRGRVVGATVVGPRAGETLGELSVAVGRGLRTRDLAAVTHAYPTYNDGVWQAAVADLRRRLAAPVPRRAAGVVVGVRRAWLDRRRAR